MFKLFAAVVLAALPMGALAAPVASPVIDVPDATGEFVSFAGRGDFLAFEAPATGQGFTISDGLSADLSLNFDLSEPYAEVDGFFALRDGQATVLEGVLRAITPQTDMLSLVFSDVMGDLAPIFGPALAIELFFFDPLGDDPLAALIDGGSYAFAYVVEADPQPAPVPLPAGGLLLLSGLGLVAARKLFRRGA